MLSKKEKERIRKMCKNKQTGSCGVDTQMSFEDKQTLDITANLQ